MTPEIFFLFLLFASLAAALMCGFPVAFTLAGVSLIIAFVADFFGYFDLSLLTAFPHRVFGIMVNEMLLSVPLFVFMGIMLERAKIAEDLLNTMGRLFIRVPGGLAIVVTIVGALLAASTGIVGATVATMGLLSLPVMLKWGYSPRLATGGICAAGTLGQIIPPSIVLVLLGDVMSAAYQRAQMDQGIFAPDTVSVGDLFAGSLIPGVMLVSLYIAYQLAYALIFPKNAPSVSLAADEDAKNATYPSIIEVLYVLIPPLALIIAVLGSILSGFATPTEAAGVGAIGACFLAAMRQNRKTGNWLLIGFLAMIFLFILSSQVNLGFSIDNRTGFVDYALFIVGIVLAILVAITLAASIWIVFVNKVLTKVCESTLTLAAMIFSILIGATLFSLVFRGLGGDDLVHQWLEVMPGGVYGALFIVMLAMFLMGFFLDFIEITFVVVPVVAPSLLAQGLDPVWLGVLIAMNLQTSFLTPPFGFALFYLRGVAPKSISTGDIYKGVIPFVGLQIIAMLLLVVFPELATWLPEKIYG